MACLILSLILSLSLSLSLSLFFPFLRSLPHHFPSDREIVALLGAHTVGRCHPDRSGFDGPWTFAPTRFSNLFFKELLNREWTVRQWNGPKQYKDGTGKLMMLPADLALRYVDC